MNAGSTPLAPAGRAIVSLMSPPSTLIVFSDTCAGGSVSLAPDWAPASTLRAFGVDCLIGLPPPASSYFRNDCTS